MNTLLEVPQTYFFPTTFSTAQRNYRMRTRNTFLARLKQTTPIAPSTQKAMGTHISTSLTIPINGTHTVFLGFSADLQKGTFHVITLMKYEDLWSVKKQNVRVCGNVVWSSWVGCWVGYALGVVLKDHSQDLTWASHKNLASFLKGWNVGSIWSRLSATTQLFSCSGFCTWVVHGRPNISPKQQTPITAPSRVILLRLTLGKRSTIPVIMVSTCTIYRWNKIHVHSGCKTNELRSAFSMRTVPCVKGCQSKDADGRSQWLWSGTDTTSVITWLLMPYSHQAKALPLGKWLWQL